MACGLSSFPGMQPELVGPSPSNSVFHINAFGSGFIEDEGVDEDGPADLEDEDPNAKFKLHSVDTGPRESTHNTLKCYCPDLHCFELSVKDDF